MGYYDYEDYEYNVLMAVTAGLSIIKEDNLFNENIFTMIKRHVIITSGPCIVGNLGSVETSVDITAMGEAVNLNARIEHYLKSSEQYAQKSNQYIFLDKSSFHILLNLNQNIEYKDITVANNIKDFPDTTELYLISISIHNFNIMRSFIDHLDDINNKNDAVTEKEYSYYNEESSLLKKLGN